MGSKSSKPYAVIAIDFGTSYSGYAFSYGDNKDNIHLNDNWNAHGQFYKTPTSVLYDNQGKFKAFGFQAEKKYCEYLGELNQAGEARPSLYRFFKLKLREMCEKKAEEWGETGYNITLQSEDQQEKDAIEVFADALRYMKDHALTRLQSDKGLTNENRAKIRWVVTVPAIWKDRQKIFMRTAAKEAGIIDDFNSEKLIIASEPECASIYCKDTKSEKFHENFGAYQGWDREKAYMVADLGGGTTDFIFHKIDGKYTKEIHLAEGDASGSHQINTNFEILLIQALELKFINYLKKSYPLTWFNLMSNFENEKRNYSKNEVISFPLPAGVSKCYNEFTENINLDFKTFLEGRQTGIYLSKELHLVIPAEVSKGLFDSVIANIVDQITKSIESCEMDVFCLFLVGGFADCSLLQSSMECLKTKSGTKLKILIPLEPNLCVLRGAVKFGHNPNVIKSRLSALTYAVLSERKFIPGKDDQVRKNEQGQVKYLERIIEKGQKVEEGTVIEREIVLSATDTFGIVQLYTSTKYNVDNPNDSHVTKLGEITIDKRQIKDSTGKQKHIKIYVTFGKEENMEVTAYDKETNEEVKARFEFKEMEKFCSIM